MRSYKEWKDKDAALFHKRREGAEKIANEARAKGGPSQMTNWHFRAKLPQYDAVFQVLKSDNPEVKVKAKFDELVSKLHSHMGNQKEFQELMGEIEVWGEVLVQLKKPQNYQ